MSKNPPISDCFTDWELILGVAEGDEQSFTRLFHRYRSKVFSVAYHLTKSPFAAEDISQEVFTGLWISRKRLVRIQSFEAYLHTVIYHKTLNYLKKEGNWKQILAWAANQKPGTTADPEQDLSGKELNNTINKAVEQLPAQKRLIYRMSREHGMNNHQIADELQISPHTVKNHLIVAVKQLRSLLRHLPLPTLSLKLFEIFF